MEDDCDFIEGNLGEEIEAGTDDKPLNPTDEIAPDVIEEPRGTKRRLNDDAIQTAENTDDADLLSRGKGLPPGVTVCWKDNRDLTATFSVKSSEAAEESTGYLTELCIVGKARIDCLAGSIEILGHRLTAGSTEIVVCSPFWSSWMTISPLPTTKETTKVTISSIRGSPSFRLAPPSRPTVIPPSWKASGDKICHDFVHAQPPTRDGLGDDAIYHHSEQQIIMICGAKGVGKSTLLRYLNNRLLQSYPDDHPTVVAILDADVGQPELAPPGMLRLSLQRHPLLNPPYWNLCHAVEEPVEQISAVYYGAVTSKVDPTRYIQAVQRLLQDYKNFLASSNVIIPLLINLDGWIKGMGFEVLKTLITSTNPSHICQLLGDSKAKTFDLSGLSTPPQDGQSNGESASESPGTTTLPAQLFYLDACTKHVTPCTVPSSTLRTLRLATYFGPQLLELWDTFDLLPASQLQTGWSGDHDCKLAQYLAQERPYCVPLEAVECIHSNVGTTSEWRDEEDGMQILRALNGSFVGLCIDQEMKCSGLGIVRSVDFEKQLLYILTPVSANQLTNVRTLVGGNIPIPLPLVFRGVIAEAFPYQTTVATTVAVDGSSGNNVAASKRVLGSEPMKSRNNIVRRGLANGGSAK